MELLPEPVGCRTEDEDVQQGTDREGTPRSFGQNVEFHVKVIEKAFNFK
jgi:hypothetical protein